VKEGAHMSITEAYVKSLSTARSLTSIDALRPSIVRVWPTLSAEERDAINQAGKAARERLTPKKPERPEPSENMPGEYKRSPSKEEPAEMPYRADFEKFTESYSRCSTRDEVRAVRSMVDELSRLGRLMIWQSRELFISDIAALRRVFELDPPKVSERTQRYLDALVDCPDYATFGEILAEAVPYSLELERADSREWWVLEHAFELRSAELRQKAKQQKIQASIPI
jgi:hypothetical protein